MFRINILNRSQLKRCAQFVHLTDGKLSASEAVYKPAGVFAGLSAHACACVLRVCVRALTRLHYGFLATVMLSRTRLIYR